uniref:Uncharacterized protein n=1 Tax=Meloidogyne enterolobii TaxID=390850 RepID=A0A6V7VYX0_MELEN|nr:unnamed protein product [Meloidogyne enterolobii]
MDPFYGDPKKWPTFWQMFSINIDQRPMDNIRKMSYLLTLLQGPAKDLVAGFVLTNENYNRALDLLKSRYGNSRAITEALEAELMNLTPPNDSSHSLRAFVDSVERICRQLEAFGAMDQSPFVSTVIKTKLPQSIVAKLIEKERPYHKPQIEKDNRITEPSHHKSDDQEQLTLSVVSTLKERPVMDTIVQTKGQSYFSDCHIKEPVLLPEFVGLILCFRFPKFIATTDLKSAFLMVGLRQIDRKFTKFQRVKDPFNLPLIEKTKVSHTVLPEKLFLKQILDEKAHGTKKRLEKLKEMIQENLAGYGIALILISLTFIISVSCNHKDQIVVCREEQTINRKKIPPDIPFKSFKYINKTLNRNFKSIYFILIISIITLIISFRLNFLSILAFFIPVILFKFLRSGEGVRTQTTKLHQTPPEFFKKFVYTK